MLEEKRQENVRQVLTTFGYFFSRTIWHSFSLATCPLMEHVCTERN